MNHDEIDPTTFLPAPPVETFRLDLDLRPDEVAILRSALRFVERTSRPNAHMTTPEVQAHYLARHAAAVNMLNRIDAALGIPVDGEEF